MTKSLITLTLMTATISILIACSKDNNNGGNGADCSNVPKTWSADVSPIIQTFCNQPGCHNAGSNNGPGPLTSRAEVFAVRNSVRDAVQSGRMPQNTTLTTAQKNSIICWIDSGAPDN
jgi:hypothetical protein